jgi:hypothetical protein
MSRSPFHHYSEAGKGDGIRSTGPKFRKNFARIKWPQFCQDNKTVKLTKGKTIIVYKCLSLNVKRAVQTKECFCP